MNYGLITFRSHPCDKQLDGEFYQLMTPILNKADKYVVAQESPLSPEAHYHILMSFHSPKHDIGKLHQKFKSKSFTNWIEKTKSTMTVISTDFVDKALQIKKVKATDEDHLKTLGYVSKENVVKSKGYTDFEITEACKYYHTCERQAPKIKNDWKILNIKTVIPYMEIVADKHKIEPYHKHVFYYMAKEKMYIDLSDKSKNNVRATLEIAHTKQSDVFEQNVLAHQLNGSEHVEHGDSDNLYEANRRLRAFHKMCKERIPDYQSIDIDGYL